MTTPSGCLCGKCDLKTCECPRILFCATMLKKHGFGDPPPLDLHAAGGRPGLEARAREALAKLDSVRGVLLDLIWALKEKKEPKRTGFMPPCWKRDRECRHVRVLDISGWGGTAMFCAAATSGYNASGNQDGTPCGRPDGEKEQP